MKIFEDAEKVLKKDDRLWSKDEDKRLLKNKLVELVSNDDEKLLELLLNDKETKEHFFKKIKDSTLFLKDKFLQFITMNEFLPDSFTAFENEIGLSDDGKLITQKEEISLVFPHKDCVLEGGQTKEEGKRDEIFYNTILAPDEVDRIKEPKVLVNWEKFNQDGGHEIKEISKKDNLIIKGNNLLALYSLLPKYRDEIKLIYIDPPYNTGNDEFGYNDKFNHSAWLTFMKNRLEVARELLSNDGVIFINIDDKEYSYLKILCDGIFLKENFLNTISVKTSDPSGHKTVNPSPYSQTEYILLYAKDKSKYKYAIHYVPSEYDTGYNRLILNPESDYKKWKIVGLFDYLAKREKYRDTREANQKLGKHIFEGLVADFALENRDRVFQLTAIADDAAKEIVKIRDLSETNNGIIYKISHNKNDIYILDGRQIYFYSNKVREIDGVLTPSKPLTNLWADIPYNGISGEGGVKLKNGKKPEKLLRRILDISTTENDLVLDFFAGAGTTGAVAHKMERRYILIEQMDYIHDLPEARLKNVIKGDQTGISKAVNWKGGGSFIYVELLEWNQKYINQLEKAKTQKEILDIYKKIEQEQFYRYKYEPKRFSLKQFKELDLKDQKRALLDILDMNHLYVNRSSMDDTTFKVDEKDKKLTKVFYEEK
ncbi:MAG: adenine specific DNA methylase [Candidatus Levybacteria bacterium CG_4_10_14_0_8_um_filter_35_23]|nr:MAG: adenine specific DNA methylase [Candidatus Levybacteria bacterium CG_4_10_14_0_8_um_filter_35_23]